jgi:hypothetical protein
MVAMILGAVTKFLKVMHTVQWPHCAAQNENEQHDNGCHVVTQKLHALLIPKKKKKELR